MDAPTVVSRASEAIRDYVVRRDLKPGDRLPTERDFARFLGISRTAVREAMRQMAAFGIIEGHRGRGTFLKQAVSAATSYVAFPVPMEKESLLDTLEVRRSLEELAVRLAARRAHPEELAGIERILDEFDASVARGFDPADADWRFHVALYRASHNPVLTGIMESLAAVLHRFWENPLNIPGFAHRTHPLHRRIFERVRDRDPDGAASLVHQMLDIVEEDIHRA